VFDIYHHTKEEYVDKPREMIANILQSKYETLKEKYPTAVNKVDELYASGKKVAETQKDRAVEVCSKTFKFYNDQKEAVKQIGQVVLLQAHEYFKNNLTRSVEEENGGNNLVKKGEPHFLKEIGYEMIYLTKKCLSMAHHYIKSLRLTSQETNQEKI